MLSCLENILQGWEIYHSELSDNGEDDGDAKDLIAEEPDLQSKL
jgi:hypothetical protein